MSIDMNAILRRAAGYRDDDEREPVEETTPPFNGGPRRTAWAPPTMNQRIRDEAWRRWYG